MIIDCGNWLKNNNWQQLRSAQQDSDGTSYTYVFTFVVIHDQLYYKGAMLGSSTPSITLSISAKSCMTSSKAISAHPSRSSCERD